MDRVHHDTQWLRARRGKRVYRYQDATRDMSINQCLKPCLKLGVYNTVCYKRVSNPTGLCPRALELGYSEDPVVIDVMDTNEVTFTLHSYTEQQQQ
jgi:hypothetical protein